MIYFLIASFVFEIVLSMVGLATALLIVEKYHVTSIFLGYLGMGCSMVYSVFAILFGPLIDRYNPKSLLILGCVFCALIWGSIPFFLNQWIVLILFISGSLGNALYWPSIISLIARGKEKEQMVKQLGLFSVAWCSGTIIGPVFGGFLYSRDFRLPFIIAGLLALTPIFLLVCMKRFRIMTGISTAQSHIIDTTQPARLQDNNLNRLLYLSWLANFINSSLVGIVRILFPQYGLSLKLTPTTIGSLITLIGITQTGTFILLMVSTRWLFHGRAIIVSQVLSWIGLYLIIYSKQAEFFAIGFSLLGFAIGVSYFASIIYSLYNRMDTGKKSGLHEGVLGAGFSLGPWIGGYWAQNFGLKFPYIFSIFFLTLAIIGETAFLVSTRRWKNQGKPRKKPRKKP